MNNARFVLVVVVLASWYGIVTLGHPYDGWIGSFWLGSAAMKWWRDLA